MPGFSKAVARTVVFVMAFAVARPAPGAPVEAFATSEALDNLAVSEAQTGRRQPSMADRLAVAQIQVLFDRAGISPGVIDGLDTARYRAARAAFLKLDGGVVRLGDPASLGAALVDSGGPAFFDYEITGDDVTGPFAAVIPHLYTEQALLPALSFVSAREMLAERFHMDEAFLAALNPDADFATAGTRIRVANVGKPLDRRVARIEADKGRLQLRAYARDGALVAVYPASVGSRETPSPIGRHTVRNKAADPFWTYDPKGSSQPGLTAGLLRLPPGPNGPVGNAWIGLSQRGYGIHGTPEPSQIGISASVGCVRLTNWDALELARLVSRGVVVEFIE